LDREAQDNAGAEHKNTDQAGRKSRNQLPPCEALLDSVQWLGIAGRTFEDGDCWGFRRIVH
jgi:hypothetical protein